MNVTSEQAVSLLTELGYENADKFSTAKMTNMLKKIISKLGDDDELDVSKASRKLVAKMVAAGKVKVTDDAVAEPAAKKAPKAEKKSAKAEKNGKPKKKVVAKGKGAGGEKDKFGSRVGTEAATINALIGKKPTTIEKIKDNEACKDFSVGRVASHIRFLKGRGFIKQDGDKVVQIATAE